MEKEKYLYIWIDDIRPVPDIIKKNYEYIVIAQDYEQAIHLLNTKEFFRDFKIIIDFDHDIGVGGTGYDIAKYIVENEIKINYFSVHSSNPIGKFNIVQLLTHYGYTYLI